MFTSSPLLFLWAEWKGCWFLYNAVCVELGVLFDLSPLDFCSESAELTANCSALLGVSPFITGWRSDWTAASVGGETTTLSMGSLAVLSVTII